jgi:hypothetical protein
VELGESGGGSVLSLTTTAIRERAERDAADSYWLDKLFKLYWALQSDRSGALSPTARIE